MRSPQPSKDTKLSKSNGEEMSPNYRKSCLSTQLSSTKSLEVYLNFKKKLLRAMQTLDPLDLLESGIFQEYEQNIGLSESISNVHHHDFEDRSVIKNTVTDFQTVIRSYEVTQDCKILQLEKRSKSCEIFNRFKDNKTSDQTIKDIKFFIQASTYKQIDDLKRLEQKQFPSPQQQLQNIKILRRSKQNISILKDQFDEQYKNMKRQNIELKQKCTQLQMVINNLRLSLKQRVQNDEHKLQYLLKEKQLQKRLNQAKNEIQQLRNMLQKANQQPVNRANLQVSKPSQDKTLTKPINSLRQRVQNEGRVKRVLQQLWVSQLHNECNISSE